MAGYTRQSAAELVSNGVITAAIFNNEFNALSAAFNAATGHDHNGSGEGARITVVGPAGEITFASGAVLPATHNVMDLGSDAVRFKDAYVAGVLRAGSVILTSALPLGSGGTGATTAEGARAALGLGSAAVANNTDGVTEGSGNLYFTSARARSAISATGSLSYNSTTGVISFTDAVTSVAGKTGAVALTASDVSGLSASATTDATNATNITSGTLNSARLPATADTNARVSVARNSGTVGARRRINFIEGSNITVSAVDDPATESVNLTFQAAGTLAVTLGGDLSGTTSSAVVSGIRSYPVSSAVPSSGNTLVFNGTSYVPANISSNNVDGLTALLNGKANTTHAHAASDITSGTFSTDRLSGSYANITGVGTLTLGTWRGTAIEAAYGGTGQTSYTAGSILYASTTNALTQLAGNASTANRFLRSTGTGLTAQAPSWAAIAAADVSGLSNSATTDTTNAANISSGTLPSARLSGVYSGVTGVGTITNGTWQANPIGAIYGGTGLNTVSSGDLLVGSASNTWGRLASNSSASVRYLSSSSSSIPSWRDLSASDITTGTLALANGGTGATTASAARSNLGAAASGSNSDITSLAGLTTALSIAQGGTGATTASAARTSLGAAGLGANTFSGAQSAPQFGIPNGITIAAASITFGTGQDSVYYDAGQVQIAAAGTVRFAISGTQANFSVPAFGPGFTTTSDRDLKTDITPVTGALDRVMAYAPVTFRWAPEVSWADGKVHQGFVAQDVEAVNPVAASRVDDKAHLDPVAIIADLVGAIQELEARLAAVEGK